MRIELRELRCLAALVVLVTAPGAGQVARVGVPGRVDYNPYFAIGLADPRLRTVLQSTDPQVLLGVVEQTVLSVGQGEVAAAVPPAALGVLAADRLAALRAFGVADSLLRLWERVRTVPADPGSRGRTSAFSRLESRTTSTPSRSVDCRTPRRPTACSTP